MANPELIESIRRTEADIRQVKDQIKDSDSVIEDITVDLPESRAIDKLTEELAGLRKKLHAVLEDDADYKSEMAVRGALKFKLADLQSILSRHLLAYREATKADYVEEEDSKKVRYIEVKAKLRGKPEYAQEKMEFEEATHASS